MHLLWAFLIDQLVKNPPAMQETPVRFLGQKDSLEKGSATHSSILGLPLWLTWQRICLQCGRPGFRPWIGKIPWRREKATHSNILAWRIPGTIQSMGSQSVRDDWAALSSLHYHAQAVMWWFPLSQGARFFGLGFTCVFICLQPNLLLEFQPLFLKR